MFNFGGITHIITNPVGHKPGFNFSLVGSVSTLMLEADGRGKQWSTVQAILDEAAKHVGIVKMCDLDGCACRRYFNLRQVWQCSFTKTQLAEALKNASCLLPEKLPRKGDKHIEYPTATGYIRVTRDPFPYSHKKPMYIFSTHRFEVVAQAEVA